MEFSIRGMKNLIKTQTGKRVSEESCKALGQILNEFGEQIAEEAIKHAAEDGRKTVREEDIRKALRDNKNREIKGK